MRNHLQGTFLLIVMLLVFWAVMAWGGDIISSALGGEDGAIVAKAPAEGNDFRNINYDLLTADEVSQLQAALAEAGFDPGPIDGILGELTRAAIRQAATALDLTDYSDRDLLDRLLDAFERQTQTPNNPTPEDPTSDNDNPTPNNTNT